VPPTFASLSRYGLVASSLSQTYGMRYGCPHAAGLGSPELAVEYLKLEQVRGTWRARWKPRSGWGAAWFGVYNNALKQTHLFAPEGVEQVVPILPNVGKDLSVLVLRLGPNAGWPDADYSHVARTFESEEAKRATLFWKWEPDEVGSISDTDTYTSSWALTGIKRSNTIVESGHKLWTYLEFSITVSGGNATVTVTRDGQTVCSGTAALGASVTLAEQNSSGISGSVTVVGGATTITGQKVFFRWPKEMKILRGTSDPPMSVAHTYTFDEEDEVTFTEPSDLAAGTYYYRIQPVSETGDDGTVSSTKSTLIPGTPQPPTNVAYASGNASGVTINFTPSSTPGATYRAYLSNVGGVLDPFTPVATAAAGATSITLPAITGSPGYAYVVIRAVNGTDEDKNANGTLELEFDASGVYIPPRPNAPEIALESIVLTSGRALSLTGVYATLDEKGVATELRLYARDPGGSYGAALATAALGAARDGLKTASLSYTFPANARKFIVLKAATAAGTLGDAGAEVRLFPTDADMPAASNFDVKTSRG